MTATLEALNAKLLALETELYMGGMTAKIREKCRDAMRAVWSDFAALQAEQGQESERETLYKCVTCGHLYQCKVSECDCTVGVPFKYEEWLAVPAITPPAEQWVSVKERLPENKREMFIVRGFNVVLPGSSTPYTTDAYAVWMIQDEFVRWPHFFPPTHWMPLPPPPIDSTDAGDKHE